MSCWCIGKDSKYAGEGLRQVDGCQLGRSRNLSETHVPILNHLLSKVRPFVTVLPHSRPPMTLLPVVLIHGVRLPLSKLVSFR